MQAAAAGKPTPAPRSERTILRRAAGLCGRARGLRAAPAGVARILPPFALRPMCPRARMRPAQGLIVRKAAARVASAQFTLFAGGKSVLELADGLAKTKAAW